MACLTETAGWLCSWEYVDMERFVKIWDLPKSHGLTWAILGSPPFWFYFSETPWIFLVPSDLSRCWVSLCRCGTHKIHNETLGSTVYFRIFFRKTPAAPAVWVFFSRPWSCPLFNVVQCFRIFFWTRMAIWWTFGRAGRQRRRPRLLRRRLPGGSKVIGRCRNESRSWRRKIWVHGGCDWPTILFGCKKYLLIFVGDLWIDILFIFDEQLEMINVGTESGSPQNCQTSEGHKQWKRPSGWWLILGHNQVGWDWESWDSTRKWWGISPHSIIYI